MQRILDDSVLDAEESRRRHVIQKLRHSDMGESATNTLMAQVSDMPEVIDQGTTPPPTPREGAQGFEITEMNRRGMVVLQTRLALIEMSDVMAARLRTLYVTHHPMNLLTPEYMSDFSRCAFLLLYRYGYVDPGFKRQGYLAPKYFEAISRAFNMPIDLEGFAAAFNTTVPVYCSLFPDVESPFGSIGSFFDLRDVRDMRLIQVSPPRIGTITSQAVEHCAELIKNSDELYIILLTPMAWADVSRQIEDTGFSVWNNNTKRGDMIEYHDVIRNLPTKYPMPRVSVLSKHQLTERTARQLHSVFSR